MEKNFNNMEGELLTGQFCIEGGNLWKDATDSMSMCYLDTIFAYKSIGTLRQIIVSRYLDDNNKGLYCVSVEKLDHIVVFSKVPYRYIKDEVLDILKDGNVDQETQNTYKAIIEDLEK